MKAQRQKKILEIIEKYDIDTQETLIDKLREENFTVTQTTISRDIKQLKLVKGTTGKGTYKYVAPGAKHVNSTPVFSSAITDSVISVVPAQNIVVVKTLSGMANAVAVCIDSLELDGLVGSVAGDDTILLVMRDNDTARLSVSKLDKSFGV